MPKRLTALGFAFRRFAVPGRVGARVFGLNIGSRYSTPVRKRPLHPTRSQFKPEPSQTQARVTPRDRAGATRRWRLNIGCRYSTPVRERPLHPTRGHFTPEPSQTQAPVTPATEPERRAGGSLTTAAGAIRCVDVKRSPNAPPSIALVNVPEDVKSRTRALRCGTKPPATDILARLGPVEHEMGRAMGDQDIGVRRNQVPLLAKLCAALEV